MKKRLIIAIDGYSSCGKSTFAKAIARELNYIYIDSGAMYRSVTLWCIRKGFAGNERTSLNGIISTIKDISINFIYNPDINEYETFLNSENVEREIRGIEVSSNVSRISQIPEVRARMVELQREIGVLKGIVMDGRDIGTVVFPDAEVKIFMTASVDIRAKRRFDEITSRGDNISLEEVKRNIVARDIADENRDISPLRRAEDAIVLDNSRMTVDQQMIWIMGIIGKRINAG
ncbi:MAG: (d)CMP kinase [Bacteroidales bacterium]|jgi:cytidylate kinase